MDNLVDVIDSRQQTFQDMNAFERLIQVKLGTATHHIYLMVNVAAQDLTQGKRARHTVNQGQVNDAKIGLKLCALIEVVKNYLRNFSTLKVDNNAHTLAV